MILVEGSVIGMLWGKSYLECWGKSYQWGMMTQFWKIEVLPDSTCVNGQFGFQSWREWCGVVRVTEPLCSLHGYWPAQCADDLPPVPSLYAFLSPSSPHLSRCHQRTPHNNGCNGANLMVWKTWFSWVSCLRSSVLMMPIYQITLIIITRFKLINHVTAIN